MVHLLPDKVLDVSCGIKPALYLPNMPPDVVSNKLPVTDLYSFVWGAIPDSRLDKKAFFDGLNPAESITFRQCRDDSKAFARGLRDKSTPWGGVKRHEFVCLFGINSLQLPAIIYGILAAGCGMTPANPNYTARELAHQLRTAKAGLLICQSAVLDAALEAAKEVGLPRERIILMDMPTKNVGIMTAAEVTKRGYHLTDQQLGGPVVFTEHDIKNVPSLLPFSSGTTGNPKGVSLTHHNLVSNLLQWTTHDGRINQKIEGEVVSPCFMPLFHMAGFMTFMMIAPRIGATVAIYPRFDLTKALEAWSKYQVPYISIVPPMAYAIAKADTSGYKFAANYVMCGSAPLGPELEDEMERVFGAKVRQGYGCTECTCAGTIYPADREYVRGAVGTPIPNLEIKVVDPETGKLVGFNKEGELWLKGPNIALGYFGNEKATNESFQAGFYRTGDLVRVDENRNVYILDRLKELIKYNAFQVAPAELEDLLMKHPDVQDVCVVGIPAEGAGEIPRAFIQLREGVARTNDKAEEIRAFLDGMVTNYKRLRGGVEFRDIIPRGATGKILRRELRDEYRARVQKEGAAKAAARL